MVNNLSEVRLSGVTRRAIQIFEKTAKTERKLSELKVELEDITTMIPEADMPVYIEKTQKITDREEERLQTFLKRRQKRAERAKKFRGN